MGFFAKLITTAIVFLGFSQFFPSLFHLSGIAMALLASFVLAILNLLIKPLLNIISLPFILLTFGLFTFIINGVMLQLTSLIVGSQNFAFSSFWGSVLLAILLTVVQMIVEDYF
ncbi:MAG: phage holin family protein, partial [Streptococcaceae bacterium]|nr:phage holin family protein [Streptococcaceae bacterium]